MKAQHPSRTSEDSERTRSQRNEELAELARLAPNCADSMNRLLERLQPLLFSVVLKKGIAMDDGAEDIVQEAMLRIASNLPRYRPRVSRITSWAYVIVSNLAINALRNRGRLASATHAYAEDRIIQIEGHERMRRLMPDYEAERKSSEARVARLVDALPESYREVVRLSLEDFNAPEIAARLEIPVGTVKSRRSRGLKLIGERLTT